MDIYSTTKRSPFLTEVTWASEWNPTKRSRPGLREEEPHGKVCSANVSPSMFCHDSQLLYIVIKANLTFCCVPNRQGLFFSPVALQQKLFFSPNKIVILDFSKIISRHAPLWPNLEPQTVSLKKKKTQKPNNKSAALKWLYQGTTSLFISSEHH